MAGENVLSVHLNGWLTNLAISYRPDLASFIADTVAPYLDVRHESDLYPVFDQGEFYSSDTDDRVPDRTEPNEVEFSHTTATYQCVRRELAFSVSDRERRNSDDVLRLEENKQSGTLIRLLLRREIRVAGLLRKTTNGGQLTLGTSASNPFAGASTTTAESDVVTGVEAMRQAVGVEPNVIIIPAVIANQMVINAQWRDYVKYTYGSDAARPMLSARRPTLPPVLWGMTVLTPGTIKNTAAEGATASYSDVWGNHVRLLYVNPESGLTNPSVAYTFRSEGLTTRQWRTEASRTERFAVGQTIDERVVAASAGYEIANA
jgi:hypothetical protein